MDQQELRRWARRNTDADCPLMMPPEQRRELAEAIFKTLGIIDSVWEAAAGRRLTELEKFGIDG